MPRKYAASSGKTPVDTRTPITRTRRVVRKTSTAFRCNKLAARSRQLSSRQLSSKVNMLNSSTKVQCHKKRFVSKAALQASADFALSNGRPISRDVKQLRRRDALDVASATVRVLEFAGVMRDLRRRKTAVVVLGFLSDIAGLMIMKHEDHTNGPHFMMLAVKDETWSYALNKDFIQCAANNKFSHVDDEVPIILISTTRNLLRSHRMREKIRVTHCEIAWVQQHQDQAKGRFQWQTFETSVQKNGSRVPFFVNLLRKV